MVSDARDWSLFVVILARVHLLVGSADPYHSMAVSCSPPSLSTVERGCVQVLNLSEGKALAAISSSSTP